MNGMTLTDLLNAGRSHWARNGADFLYIRIEGNAPYPEHIINKRGNFEAKLDYYSKAYNEDLTLKSVPSIKITDYAFVTRADLFEYYL